MVHVIERKTFFLVGNDMTNAQSNLLPIFTIWMAEYRWQTLHRTTVETMI